MGIPVPKPKFKRYKPTTGQRSEFPRNVRKQIKERDCGECYKCGSSYGIQIHHIISRAQGGRGVLDNGVCLCLVCHDKVTNNREERDKLINEWTETHEDGFWKDQWDEGA
jgi:5-methylcytosine-specific restriction endonuclease McrA